MARTPEQGHTRKCLAHAIICAVENIRDRNDNMSDAEYGDSKDLGFRLAMQDGEALREADAYLESGTVTCLCD